MTLIRATSEEWWGRKATGIGSGEYWHRQIKKTKVNSFEDFFNSQENLKRQVKGT